MVMIIIYYYLSNFTISHPDSVLSTKRSNYRKLLSIAEIFFLSDLQHSVDDLYGSSSRLEYNSMQNDRLTSDTA